MTARHRRGTRHQGNQGINTHGDTNPHGKDILQNGKDGSRNRKDDDKFPTLFKRERLAAAPLAAKKNTVKEAVCDFVVETQLCHPGFIKHQGNQGK